MKQRSRLTKSSTLGSIVRSPATTPKGSKERSISLSEVSSNRTVDNSFNKLLKPSQHQNQIAEPIDIMKTNKLSEVLNDLEQPPSNSRTISSRGSSRKLSYNRQRKLKKTMSSPGISIGNVVGKIEKERKAELIQNMRRKSTFAPRVGIHKPIWSDNSDGSLSSDGAQFETPMGECSPREKIQRIVYMWEVTFRKAKAARQLIKLYQFNNRRVFNFGFGQLSYIHFVRKMSAEQLVEIPGFAIQPEEAA